MEKAFLVFVIFGSIVLQYWLDAQRIKAMAREYNWSVAKIVWSPFARLWKANKWDRWYWFTYRDERGKAERKLCRVRGFLGIANSILFDGELVPAYPRPAYAVPPPPPFATNNRGGIDENEIDARPYPAWFSRIINVVALTCIGGFVGMAVGIFGCMAIFPNSNIAPAYGIIYVAPAGALLGFVYGMLRKRH
jgi:hypothetical protein